MYFILKLAKSQNMLSVWSLERVIRSELTLLGVLNTVSGPHWQQSRNLSTALLITTLVWSNLQRNKTKQKVCLFFKVG